MKCNGAYPVLTLLACGLHCAASLETSFRSSLSSWCNSEVSSVTLRRDALQQQFQQGIESIGSAAIAPLKEVVNDETAYLDSINRVCKAQSKIFVHPEALTSHPSLRSRPKALAAVQLASTRVDLDKDELADMLGAAESADVAKDEEEDPALLYKKMMGKAKEAAGDGELPKDDREKAALAVASADKAMTPIEAPSAIERRMLEDTGVESSFQLPKVWSPKQRGSSFLERGSPSRAHSNAAIKLDSDFEVMESLYKQDGSLPDAYQAWEPPASFLQVASATRSLSEWCDYLHDHVEEVPMLQRAAHSLQAAEDNLVSSKASALELQMLNDQVPATRNDVQALQSLLQKASTSPDAAKLADSLQEVLAQRQKLLQTWEARASALRIIGVGEENTKSAASAVEQAKEDQQKAVMQVKQLTARCLERNL